MSGPKTVLYLDGPSRLITKLQKRLNQSAGTRHDLEQAM